MDNKILDCKNPYQAVNFEQLPFRILIDIAINNLEYSNLYKVQYTRDTYNSCLKCLLQHDMIMMSNPSQDTDLVMNTNQLLITKTGEEFLKSNGILVIPVNDLKVRILENLLNIDYINRCFFDINNELLVFSQFGTSKEMIVHNYLFSPNLSIIKIKKEFYQDFIN